MTSVAVQTRGLGRRFGAVKAVDQVSLSVAEGSIFGLLGPNGAGKSTMIRLLLGLVEPTEGSAQVLGLDTRAHAASIRERTGALLEHTGLYERLTAEENLELFARIARLAPEQRRTRIRELLDGMGLWERRRDVVGAWSRGMKQRLAVARALIAWPALVFLDEPTAGLDPLAARLLREELATMVRDRPMTVFITTHNLAEAERLCDHVAVMSHGRLLAVGTPGEIAGSAASLEEAFVHLVEESCGATSPA